MAYEHNENNGSLFREEEKKSDKSPDFTGTANIGGTIMRIAGWRKTGGTKDFISLAFTPKDVEDARRNNAESAQGELL